MFDPEALAMPHRLLTMFPYPKTFAAGLASGGSSILAAAMDERAIAIAMAVVAFGTVVAQPLMRLYEDYRNRKRTNDAADRAQQTGEFEIEVRRRLELEDEVKRLKLQNDDQQEQINKLRRGAGEAVKELNTKAESNAKRLDAVEAQQGSTSAIDIPVTPPPPKR